MLKNYFSLVFVFFFLSKIYSQTTAIPDNNFEQALIDLGIDSDGIINQSVLTSDISGITSLNIDGKNINDLTGIKDFINLDILLCRYNNLTSLNVSQNNVLTELLCDDNQLTSLDVSKNINLEILTCTNNSLSELNLSQNTALTVLKSSNNQLTNLDLSLNTNLESLESMDNQLTSLNIGQNNVLWNIYCQRNQLTNLDVSLCPMLLWLYSENNQITSLDLTQNTVLFQVNCSNNEISSLDVSNNTSIERLWCNDNQLTMLDVKNGNNSIISYFDAQNNFIPCIQVDNAAEATAGNGSYSTWVKDATTTYSEDCGYALSIDDELLAQSLSFYPNPVTNILTIDSEIPLTKVEIYSVLGRKVKEVNSDFESIPTSNLSNGVYFARMYSENGLVTKKLIKK